MSIKSTKQIQHKQLTLQTDDSLIKNKTRKENNKFFHSTRGIDSRIKCD